MSDRTITLNAKQVGQLQNGLRVWWDDNTGREVLLLPDGADPGDVYDNAIVVTLSPGHVKEIADPGGLLLLRAPFGQADSSYVIQVETA
jgi:hypothetical protein